MSTFLSSPLSVSIKGDVIDVSGEQATLFIIKKSNNFGVDGESLVEKTFLLQPNKKSIPFKEIGFLFIFLYLGYFILN